jgi:hypothetical protein
LAVKVLSLIVALPARMLMPPPVPVRLDDVPPSAWLPVNVQPVTVRVPSRLRRPPPRPSSVALPKATFWERTSAESVRSLPSFKILPPWSRA